MYVWQRVTELAVTVSHLLDERDKSSEEEWEEQFVFIAALTGRH